MGGNGGLSLPKLVARSGLQTFVPALLSTWEIDDAVWSDRAYAYTDLGSFTTPHFQYKVRTSVDMRKVSYTVVAPGDASIEVYVVGETKRVSAPWARMAGEPDLDESWVPSDKTLPTYEAAGVYQFDFCRSKVLDAGESASFCATAGGKVDIFIRRTGCRAKVDLALRAKAAALAEVTRRYRAALLPCRCESTWDGLRDQERLRDDGSGAAFVSRVAPPAAEVFGSCVMKNNVAVVSETSSKPSLPSCTQVTSPRGWGFVSHCWAAPSSRGRRRDTREMAPVGDVDAALFGLDLASKWGCEGSVETVGGLPSKLLCDLPAFGSFSPIGTQSIWASHVSAPCWLFGRVEDGLLFHVPSETLWRCGDILSRVYSSKIHRQAMLAFAEASDTLLMRTALMGWRRVVWKASRWRGECLDELEHQEQRWPLLRKAPRGLRHGRLGVSPPPAEGWQVAARGWESHETEVVWLRKIMETGGAVFFHVPTQELWQAAESGFFTRLDTHHTALAAFVSKAGAALMRICMASWSNQVQVVRTWRHRIRVFRPIANDCTETRTSTGGSVDGGGGDLYACAPVFPGLAAFRRPSATAFGQVAH